MKVVTLKDIPDLPVEGADRIEGWTRAGVALAPNDLGIRGIAELQLQRRQFQPGLHDRLDTHDCDQLLIVVSGSGMVANEREQREIKVGDVAHIKAGERHWHGAKADTTMGRITIIAFATARPNGADLQAGYQQDRRDQGSGNPGQPLRPIVLDPRFRGGDAGGCG